MSAAWARLGSHACAEGRNRVGVGVARPGPGRGGGGCSGTGVGEEVQGRHWNKTWGEGGSPGLL